MADELLPYYDRELTFLKDLFTKEFAKANPKMATRLGIGPDSIKDPVVERLINGVAYLNARIRHKLDDEYPELTDALLGVLYPHYLAPIPSMAIVQFELDPASTARETLKRGTELETDPIDGEPCRFRTCYDVDLWPVTVESARLIRRPFPVQSPAGTEDAESLLHMTLTCTNPELSFTQLSPKFLRFFLKGHEQHVYPLYELLLNNPLKVVVGGDDKQQVVMTPDCIRPVGFGQDEGMLPYPSQSFMGYRLLTEFFSFPTKFLFCDIVFSDRYNEFLTKAGQKALAKAGEKLDVYIFSRTKNADLEHALSADHFVPGCTPVVNLFSKRAEPIALKHTQFEHEVIPDRRRRRNMEIYSIDRVSASDNEGNSLDYLPFYGTHHAKRGEEARRFWHACRRPAREFEGSEVFIDLVDLDLRPSSPADQKLGTSVTCLNRDLPDRLPFGGGQPRLQLRDGGIALQNIQCLTKPTQTIRPPIGRHAVWGLVSHLSLSYLSIVGGHGTSGKNNSGEALREILRLYDFSDSEVTRAMVEGIVGVQSRSVPCRLRREGHIGICRGTEVTIRFDETRFPGRELFLLASVLERFLALYCSINSFTKLKAVIDRGNKVLCQWPPRAGEQTLL